MIFITCISHSCCLASFTESCDIYNNSKFRLMLVGEDKEQYIRCEKINK